MSHGIYRVTAPEILGFGRWLTRSRTHACCLVKSSPSQCTSILPRDQWCRHASNFSCNCCYFRRTRCNWHHFFLWVLFFFSAALLAIDHFLLHNQTVICPLWKKKILQLFCTPSFCVCSGHETSILQISVVVWSFAYFCVFRLLWNVFTLFTRKWSRIAFMAEVFCHLWTCCEEFWSSS